MVIWLPTHHFWPPLQWNNALYSRFRIQDDGKSNIAPSRSRTGLTAILYEGYSIWGVSMAHIWAVYCLKNTSKWQKNHALSSLNWKEAMELAEISTQPSLRLHAQITQWAWLDKNKHDLNELTKKNQCTLGCRWQLDRTIRQLFWCVITAYGRYCWQWTSRAAGGLTVSLSGPYLPGPATQTKQAP
jgi:hypothetical protein